MDVFFRRLKINHDMHEFILDSGTVANTNKGGEQSTPSEEGGIMEKEEEEKKSQA
jgi:hypothetical protein